MSTVASAAITAVAFAALYAGHQVGDHVVQTTAHAAGKGAPTTAGVHPWTGWAACLKHVASYTATQAVALAIAGVAAPLSGWGVLAALAVSASTHAVIDRRWIVRRLIEAKGCQDWRDGPYLLDQSLHAGALLVAAVLGAVVGTPRAAIVVLMFAMLVVGAGLTVERRVRVPQRS
jgi:hypothetical protein